MSSLSSPDRVMRDHSSAIIFTVLEFLFTHTTSVCPRIETSVWGFLLENPSIPYLCNILGVISHVYPHAELIEVLTNPPPGHLIKRKQQALDKATGKLDWKPIEDPEGLIFNSAEYRYLQQMHYSSWTKWMTWRMPNPQAIRFPDMADVDKVKVLSRVGQLLDWISWAGEAYEFTERSASQVHLSITVTRADIDTILSIRDLRGLKRVVAEAMVSLLPLQFADGRPRRGNPLRGCQNDCDGKKSGLRRAVMCDSCLSDMPLGISPKIISEVREGIVPLREVDLSEQQAVKVQETIGQMQTRMETERNECNKHGAPLVRRATRHRRAGQRRTASGLQKIQTSR
ncbi:MAG: hypothetical protein M1839_005754 [Geoglossum umbratile]|nr:MAG: hypothetical protein M1839_005754 [Geoglossum umbratile]